MTAPSGRRTVGLRGNLESARLLGRSSMPVSFSDRFDPLLSSFLRSDASSRRSILRLQLPSAHDLNRSSSLLRLADPGKSPATAVPGTDSGMSGSFGFLLRPDPRAPNVHGKVLRSATQGWGISLDIHCTSLGIVLSPEGHRCIRSASQAIQRIHERTWHDCLFPQLIEVAP
jgi:hypothetical protein